MKPLKQNLIVKVILLTLSLSVSTLSIANHHSEGETRKKRGAPPEAIEACNSLNEGDSCQFTGHRGEVSGTCFVPPKKDKLLVCKPQRKPKN